MLETHQVFLAFSGTGGEEEMVITCHLVHLVQLTPTPTPDDLCRQNDSQPIKPTVSFFSFLHHSYNKLNVSWLDIKYNVTWKKNQACSFEKLSLKPYFKRFILLTTTLCNTHHQKDLLVLHDVCWVYSFNCTVVVTAFNNSQ